MRRRSPDHPGARRAAALWLPASWTPAPARAAALTLALVAALGAVACDSGTTEPDPPEGPFLYLVLGERSIDVGGDPSYGPGQHAVLLTLSPGEPIVYRTAIRFAMENRRGSRFGWAPLDRTGSVTREPGPDTMAATWVLPDNPWAGLGAADLVPGETYTLAVDTEGEAMEGATTMPAPIDARLTAGGVELAWGAVAGAGGYRVIIDGEATLVTDSPFPLSAAQQQAASIVVDALDPNAWAYHTDPRADRPGLSRGYGVFGAMTRDTVR